MTRLDLGVGIVAVPGIDLIWEHIADVVDVLEVEPQTFWRSDGTRFEADTSAYDWILERRRPIVCHGVGFPVGGSVPPPPQAVELFAAACRHLDAVMASEHLSFNRLPGGVEAGFLLPPRQVPAVAELARDNVQRYRAALDIPFSVETGTNYVQADPSELTDGRFFEAVVERADCGLLLDLHNVWANERNGRQPVAEMLGQLPVERVTEVHVAGGFELHGMWLDAHSGSVPSELVALLRRTLDVLPNVRAVVFEALPEYLVGMGGEAVRARLDELRQVVTEARRHGAGRPRNAGGRSHRNAGVSGRAAGHSDGTTAADVLASERAMIDYTTRTSADPPSVDDGYGMLRMLTDNARLGRIASIEPTRFSEVLKTQRRTGAPLLHEYLSTRPTHLWPAVEAQGFVDWSERHPSRSR